MTSLNKNVLAIIPARYSSIRFPGKALAHISGKPMIQWVYESTQKSNVYRTIVATDDKRILKCVEKFGGEAIITSDKHETGTDRIYEVAAKFDAEELILNVQGDEPLISPDAINDLINAMHEKENADMGTMAVPIHFDSPDFTDPNVVKVVIDQESFALYFSRAPIPHRRFPFEGELQPLKHWGIYAFRKDFLQNFVTLPPGRLEKVEKLEQLRALENGANIFVAQTSSETVGVDVPSDIERVEAILSGE